MRTRILQIVFTAFLCMGALLVSVAQNDDYMHYRYLTNSDFYKCHEGAASLSLRNSDTSFLMDILREDSVHVSGVLHDCMKDWYHMSEVFFYLKKEKSTSPSDWKKFTREAKFVVCELNYFQAQMVREQMRMRSYRETPNQFPTYFSLMKYLEANEKELMAGMQVDNLETLWIAGDFQKWWTLLTAEWMRYGQQPFDRNMNKWKNFLGKNVIPLKDETTVNLDGDFQTSFYVKGMDSLVNKKSEGKRCSYYDYERAFYSVMQTGDTAHVMDAFRRDFRYCDDRIPRYLKEMYELTKELSTSKSDEEYIYKTWDLIHNFNIVESFRSRRRKTMRVYQNSPQDFASYLELREYMLETGRYYEDYELMDLWKAAEWNITVDDYEYIDDTISEYINGTDSEFEEWWKRFSLTWEQYPDIPFPQNAMEWKHFLHDTAFSDVARKKEDDPIVVVENDEEDGIIIRIPQEKAEFPGGMTALRKYLMENTQYPPAARENGFQGVVQLQFVVEKDGSIRQVTVLKGVCKDLDEEAIRVVKNMPKWKAGKNNGQTCRSYFYLPITFTLQ